MVTMHEVITVLVSLQISISSLQTHTVSRCVRSRHWARKCSLRTKRSIRNVCETVVTASIIFFSSRRRHTRSLCDWSSDVCSSDLMIRRPPRSTTLYLPHATLAFNALAFDTVFFPKDFKRTTFSLSVSFPLWDNGQREIALSRARSEERRVGKECRSRWSPYH